MTFCSLDRRLTMLGKEQLHIGIVYHTMLVEHWRERCAIKCDEVDGNIPRQLCVEPFWTFASLWQLPVRVTWHRESHGEAVQ